jgi:hypothetical protein
VFLAEIMRTIPERSGKTPRRPDNVDDDSDEADSDVDSWLVNDNVEDSIPDDHHMR